MALDIHIIGDDGRPSGEFVAIGVDTHGTLLERATTDFPFLHRLDDYYADTSFTVNEIAFLKAELRRLVRTGLEDTIAKLMALLDKAESAGKGVTAIAD